MREMEIPPFPRKFDNPDLGDFLRQRLSQTSVLWPEQAIPLVGRSADALITPSIDAIESRPPAENTAKKQRGRPFKAGRSGCRRALLYGEAKAIARHRKKKLLGLLTIGILIIGARDFDAWYRSERAKGKWPSQRSKLKIGGGRPTKQVKRVRKAVIKLVHDGKWSGKASIAKLHRLLIDSGGFEVPSPDTLARLVERLHAETGEAEFFRAKRTRRK